MVNPKSGALRTREYRKRLSAKKQELFKERDRQRKKDKYVKRSKQQKDADRVKERLKKQVQRKKKAAMLIAQANNSATADDLSCSYTSNQSLSKAVNRVRKHLPQSIPKQKSVILKLASDAGFLKPASSAPSAEISDVDKIITDFFLSNDISYQASGRKECMAVKDDLGRKQIMQKRYMLFSLRECYSLFRSKLPEVVVGKSKFAALRPPNVVTYGKIPHEVCVCVLCENLGLLLRAHNSLPSRHELVNLVVCKRASQCMNNQCSVCSDLKLFYIQKFLTEVSDAEPSVIIQWCKDTNGHWNKTKNQSSFGNLVMEIAKQLPKFLAHCYVKEIQSAIFKRFINDSSTPTLQVDFSENFSFSNQCEIQSAHWNKTQCTLFTAVLWTCLDGAKITQSYVVVSDYLEHDKYAVDVFMKLLISDIITLHPNLEVLNVFTDGAGSHFKQRFTLANMSTYTNPRLTWNFFASYHGKGAVDGVGSSVKRMVFNATKAHRWPVLPSDAESFANCARELNCATKVLFCSKENVLLRKTSFEEEVGNVHAVPNIHKVHCIKVIAPYLVRYACTSQSDDIGTLFSFKINEGDAQAKESCHSSITTMTTNVFLPFRLGDFVECYVLGKGRHLAYAAEIKEVISNNEYLVQYLKHFVGQTYSYSVGDYVVASSDVVRALPKPTVSKRGLVIFPDVLHLNNI